MRILTKIAIIALGFSVTLFANDAKLLEYAKKEGLKAIPTDKKELYKLIDNPNNRLSPAKIKLGKMLYYDTRLSKGNDISCNTCHLLDKGGDDNVAVAVGHKGAKNPHHLNSPTVYNAVFLKHQFWDGRSPDLEAQAKGPIQAPPEMAMTMEEAVKAIKAVKGYLPLFKKAFPNEKDPITFDTITNAIGAFERTLVTPSRFDKFMNGDLNALTKEEKEGLREFLDHGCVACHKGIGVGDGRMEFFKMVHPYDYKKLGDFNGNRDNMVKIPTLRNIIETKPYFHNGSTKDLKKAIKIMGFTQLGIELNDTQIKKIYTFLKSLTGKKPDTTIPKLPK